MGIFSSITDRIFHHASAAPAQQQQQPSSSNVQQPRSPSPAAQQQQAPESATQQQTGAATAQPVDVEAVLTQIAARKAGGGNWRTSIVDLLKLLDLDSSLDARKKLADELGVHAGAPGSAEENMALQKAVMRKLAENGGKVPDNLLH